MHLTRCDTCQMIFQNPLLPEFTDGDYYQGAGAQFYLSPDKLRNDHSPVRYERELHLLRQHCRSGRVLDVGCGTGGFLLQLQHQFAGDYRTLGNDIAGPAVDHAASLGVPIHRGPLEDLPADSPFDAVTYWAVLEHLPDPQAFLRLTARLVRPGGILITLVPNFRSLAVRLLGRNYRYILPQHVNYFTADTLRQLIENTGDFEVVKIQTTHFNPWVIWQDFRNQGQPVPDVARAQLLARTNALKRNPLLAPLRWIYRLVESTLAVFGLADNVVLISRRRNAAA